MENNYKALRFLNEFIENSGCKVAYQTRVSHEAELQELKDFGSYSDIPVIPVSILANSSKFNLFFSTLDENVIGIRNWVIYWLFVLFGFAVIMSLRK